MPKGTPRSYALDVYERLTGGALRMALADPAGLGGEREGRVIGDTLGVEAKLAGRDDAHRGTAPAGTRAGILDRRDPRRIGDDEARAGLTRVAELQQPRRIGDAQGRHVGLAAVKRMDRPEARLHRRQRLDLLQLRQGRGHTDRSDS